ncbi:MAG: hypothetical protein A3D92_24075 [Bacteroidetes bacterium RIFCSPHIGHO2_02_FULL_44_7]|nr:MAG: hypothetical protein A3D92_24075 [Bacteroidetes bacterium RIFCSPHIGHO2_02_FULL_44_7]
MNAPDFFFRTKQLWIMLSFVSISVFLFGQQDVEPTKVLFIGNSYTHYNDMPGLFQNIAESKGENVLTEMDAKSNHTFKMHTKRPELFEHIKKRQWDFVVLQGFSRELSFSHEYMDTATVPYFKQILDSVYANNPCTKVLLYMTWGYRTGFPDQEEIDTYEKMAEAVKNGYKYLASKYSLAIVPVGDVYEQIHKTGDGSLFHCLYQKDEQHPSVTGSYAIANTFYSAIFRNSPINAYHRGLSREDAQVIQTVAYEYINTHQADYNLNEDYFEIKYDWSSNGDLIIDAKANYGMAVITWDFGDGTVAQNPVAHHEYNRLGDYPISLAVQARCGNYRIIERIDLDNLPVPSDNHPSVGLIEKNIRRAKKQLRKDG